MKQVTAQTDRINISKATQTKMENAHFSWNEKGEKLHRWNAWLQTLRKIYCIQCVISANARNVIIGWNTQRTKVEPYTAITKVNARIRKKDRESERERVSPPHQTLHVLVNRTRKLSMRFKGSFDMEFYRFSTRRPTPQRIYSIKC